MDIIDTPPLFVYWGPLLSAFLYVIAALALKQGMVQGTGAIRTIWICNAIQALVFLPLFWFAEGPILQLEIWKPLIVSLCLFIGEIFVIIAIRSAAVSVQSPVMGSKVVMVAALSIFIGVGTVTFHLWVAASLAAMAVFILGLSGFRKERGLFKGIACALAAAACFAMEDVLIQKWSHDYGPYSFLAIASIGIAFWAVFLLPFMKDDFKQASKKSKLWIYCGATLMALQGVTYSLPISLYGYATIVNICYSSRGIWSVLFAWTIGHYFGSMEHKAGKRVFFERLTGAMLLFIAIIIALIGGG